MFIVENCPIVQGDPHPTWVSAGHWWSLPPFFKFKAEVNAGWCMSIHVAFNWSIVASLSLDITCIIPCRNKKKGAPASLFALFCWVSGGVVWVNLPESFVPTLAQNSLKKKMGKQVQTPSASTRSFPQGICCTGYKKAQLRMFHEWDSLSDPTKSIISYHFYSFEFLWR